MYLTRLHDIQLLLVWKRSDDYSIKNLTLRIIQCSMFVNEWCYNYSVRHLALMHKVL